MTTSSVITRYNYAEVDSIIKLSHQIGANRVVFNRYIGAPLPTLEPTRQELQIAVQETERQKELLGDSRVGFGTPIPHCFVSNTSNGCTAGYLHLTIDPWGYVRRCPHVSWIAGNILEDPLATILHNPVMEEWRQDYLTQCTGCDQHGNCFAGCRAAALLHPSRRDPLIC